MILIERGAGGGAGRGNGWEGRERGAGEREGRWEGWLHIILLQKTNHSSSSEKMMNVELKTQSADDHTLSECADNIIKNPNAY